MASLKRKTKEDIDDTLDLCDVSPSRSQASSRARSVAKEELRQRKEKSDRITIEIDGKAGDEQTSVRKRRKKGWNTCDGPCVSDRKLEEALDRLEPATTSKTYSVSVEVFRRYKPTYDGCTACLVAKVRGLRAREQKERRTKQIEATNKLLNELIELND